jgi:hypothetical protein
MKNNTTQHLMDLWSIAGPANATIEASADQLDIVITTLLARKEGEPSAGRPMCNRFSVVIPSRVLVGYEDASDKNRSAADTMLREILEEEMVRCQAGKSYPDSVVLARLFTVSSEDLHLAS